MSQEFVSFVKSLKVPLLNPDEIAALGQLDQEWRHWEQRERKIMPLRIEAEQKAAYAAFLDDPIEANEHRLAVLADSVLTGTRYALLRRAFGDLRRRISAQAGEILKPVIERISGALATEHTRRLEKAEPIFSSKHNNPAVKEARNAVECADRIGGGVYQALNGQCDESPLQLAGGLISGE